MLISARGIAAAPQCFRISAIAECDRVRPYNYQSPNSITHSVLALTVNDRATHPDRTISLSYMPLIAATAERVLTSEYLCDS